MTGSQAKLLVKRYEPKQLPDHLIRAPMDTSYSGAYSPKRSKSGGSPMGGKKNLKQNKKAKELMRKMESEGKRVKRAEDNKKLVFAELKKILEAKSDDENLMPPTFNCTVA